MPTQNLFVEQFNRTYRDELLDFYIFRKLSEVREITDPWIEEYNRERQHELLENLTPEEYSATHKGLETATFARHQKGEGYKH